MDWLGGSAMWYCWMTDFYEKSEALNIQMWYTFILTNIFGEYEPGSLVFFHLPTEIKNRRPKVQTTRYFDSGSNSMKI